MGLRSRNKVSPNFNMSSMTDIVFLLLIFFMLTSTLVNPNAVKVSLPSSSTRANVKQTVAVAITEDLRFFIDGQEVEFAFIEPMLIQKMGNNPDNSIVLHSDKTVPIQEVMKVLNVANENKFKLVLATKAN